MSAARQCVAVKLEVNGEQRAMTVEPRRRCSTLCASNWR